MWYRYETHLHTAEVSRCAVASASEYARSFSKRGFAGVIVTDHFVNANCTVDRSLPWREQMLAFYEGYENLRKAGEPLGLSVFFGWEMPRKGSGEDYLTYGPDIGFLIAHPELCDLSIADYVRLIRENGGFITRAHPFRQASYIPPNPSVDASLIDAVEVQNGASDDPDNNGERAWEWAREHPEMIRASGTDIHKTAMTGVAGMAFPYPLRDIAHFLRAMRAGDGRLIIDGEVCDRDGRRL